MTNSDLAAAQQRLAERRSAREAQLRAREASTAASQPRPGLGRIANSSRRLWTLISGREGTRPHFRVSQLDAELLDEELLGLFRGQVGEGLKYFGAHLKDDWSSEISLILRAVLFKLTIWDHNASYGAALQNLRYADARRSTVVPAAPTRAQKALYGLISIVGPYSWAKWEDHLADQEAHYNEPSPRMRKFSRLTSLGSSTYSFAAFFSFLVFLVNGKYRTVLDRILRLRLTPRTSQVSRAISFEYLNRQLVWHAFTEFLLFVLPLVGVGRWRRLLSRIWRKARSITRSKGRELADDMEARGELACLPERTCAICYKDQNPTNASENEVVAASGASSGIVGSAQTDVTNPYEASPCGCIYCFVCLAQRLEGEEGEGWTCLRCGELITSCRPWNGDVVEETEQSDHANGSAKQPLAEFEGSQEESEHVGLPLQEPKASGAVADEDWDSERRPSGEELENG